LSDQANFKERILARTAELAGVPREDVHATTTLEAVGLDSSDAVVLALEAEEFAGQEVDVGIFLRFPTIGDAIDDLLERLSSGRPLA